MLSMLPIGRVARIRNGLGRKARVKAVDTLFEGLAALGRLDPRGRPDGTRVLRVCDVPYRASGRTEHLLDVFRPTAHPGPWPVVLYVHGGAFRILSKDSHWSLALAFAHRGYLVFNISYRLAPKHPFPAALEDTCAAYAWVVRNAAAHGGDPTRIAIAGESAGANLVTALSVCTSYRRPEPFAEVAYDAGAPPCAVLPACGILQASDAGRFRRKRKLPAFVADYIEETSDAYLGSTLATAAERELADPLVFLERALPPDRPLPAFFAGVGTRDPLLDDTRRLKTALDRLHVPCEARYYDGEMHAFHALAFRPNSRRFWHHTFSFLARTAS
jgi:acetyl esterase